MGAKLRITAMAMEEMGGGQETEESNGVVWEE